MVLVRNSGANYHMISAYLDEETYKSGKQSGVRWAHLIKLGLQNTATQVKFNTLMLQFNELQEKQRRTAELLGKYAGETHDFLE